jgi:hypothetical protein
MNTEIKNHEHMKERVNLKRSKRAVVGILTEPLRGSLTKEGIEVGEIKEYIPSAHVSFLEQSSLRVVPISYRLDKEELE